MRAAQPVGIAMRVEIGDVSDVVAERFHPVRERKLPEQPFARTQGQRRVEDLAIFAIWSAKADLDAAAPVPFVLAVVIERELIGPAIVGLPRIVAALKDVVRPAIVADDENHIALQTARSAVSLPKYTPLSQSAGICNSAQACHSQFRTRFGPIGGSG